MKVVVTGVKGVQFDVLVAIKFKIGKLKKLNTYNKNHNTRYRKHNDSCIRVNLLILTKNAIKFM